MRELSIFMDESGDFGPLTAHSPFYLLGIVLHEQSADITAQLDYIRSALHNRGLPAGHGIHAGPLIRREQDYRHMPLPERRSLFRALFDFVRRSQITWHTWTFDKRQLHDPDKLIAAMSRSLGALIRENYGYFQQFDRVIIYYDNGQKEITNMVNSVFNALLANAEVRRIRPADYSLFQAADLCCTLALLQTKLTEHSMSKSENVFFSTPKASAEQALRKNYLKPLNRQRFPR